jgi:hypothetical protein
MMYIIKRVDAECERDREKAPGCHYLSFLAAGQRRETAVWQVNKFWLCQGGRKVCALHDEWRNIICSMRQSRGSPILISRAWALLLLSRMTRLELKEIGFTI